MTDAARILIIDDDADSREIMRVVLTHVGHSVATVADGTQGLAKFGTGHDWDLVLLDQMMPGMSGLETLRHLRMRDPRAKVILMTAYATIDIAIEALRGGVEDFLRKPFSVEVLRGAVQAALAQTPRTAGATSSGADSSTPAASGAERGPCLVNGYRFRHVPLQAACEETAALQVCRAFEVESPSGEKRYCAVDVALLAREMMRVALGQECPPGDPVWDRICENALANYLWEKARVTSDSLRIYDLTAEQLKMARALLDAKPDDDAASRL